MPRSLDKYFQQVLTNAKRLQMRTGVNQQVAQNEAIRKGIHRVPSLTEINTAADAVALKPLHHYVFCSHNVPYWRTCSKCGRDKELAARNAKMILAKAVKLP